MSMEWGNDLIMHFIEAYKSESLIWDQRHRHHKDRRLLAAAWERIARRTNVEVADLKKKKESIMASFRGLVKKKRNSLATGSPYHPIWFAYEALEDFLQPELARCRPGHDKPGAPQEAETVEEVTYHEDSDQAEYLEEQDLDEDTYGSPAELVIKQEPKQVQKTTTFVSHQAKPRLTIKRPIKKRILKTASENSSISEMRILEALKTLKKNDGCKRKKDECDTFGEYIAESLRKHDDRTQSMIKQAINNILFEQEMKKYNSEQYVVIANVNEEDNPLMLGDQDSK